MKDYSLIESVLSGVYSATVGYGEDEAMDELLGDLDGNPVFRLGFVEELNCAFLDKDLSWKDLLAKHDVFFVDEEKIAKQYAKKILWDVANPNDDLPDDGVM